MLCPECRHPPNPQLVSVWRAPGLEAWRILPGRTCSYAVLLFLHHLGLGEFFSSLPLAHTGTMAPLPAQRSSIVYSGPEKSEKGIVTDRRDVVARERVLDMCLRLKGSISKKRERRSLLSIHEVLQLARFCCCLLAHVVSAAPTDSRSGDERFAERAVLVARHDSAHVGEIIFFN